MIMDESHYLKDELYTRISTDPTLFDFLQSGSLDGLWYWDLENPENEWMNAKFWELLGYDPKEKKHLASEWQELINPDDLKVAIENFQKHCEDPNHPYDQIVRYTHKNGKTIWVRCRGIAIRDEQGKPIRMLGAHNDLTELKELEERLRHMASTDALTGFMNRRCFEEHFEWTLKDRQRTSEMLSVAMIDIDHFKNINDTYGHQMGDSVLIAVTSAIKQGCRENDFPARWGGEEFIVLLHGADVEQSMMIAERIRENIANLKIIECEITVSIGVSTFLPETVKVTHQFMEHCISMADKALYTAKNSGRNRVVHSTKMEVVS
jgi:diguanylate cyclase (GGDEF)-like protein/PAS domain S-box-containing protein